MCIKSCQLKSHIFVIAIWLAGNLPTCSFACSGHFDIIDSSLIPVQSHQFFCFINSKTVNILFISLGSCFTSYSRSFQLYDGGQHWDGRKPGSYSTTLTTTRCLKFIFFFFFKFNTISVNSFSMNNININFGCITPHLGARWNEGPLQQSHF